MSVNRWKLFSMPVVVLGIASPMLIDCGGKIPGGDGALGNALSDAKGLAEGCDEFKSGSFGSLDIKGDAKVQSKVKAFLQVSYDVNKTVVDLEKDLITSCSALGKDLGMAEADLKAEAGGGKGAEKVCNAVAAKLKTMLAAQAEAKLAVEFDPPKCYADVDGMAKCLDSCGSPIEPGKLEASCSGGEISGKCDAECKGKCSVEAGAQCTGTCRAACSGSCDAGFKGSCGGKCDGKCDGKEELERMSHGGAILPRPGIHSRGGFTSTSVTSPIPRPAGLAAAPRRAMRSKPPRGPMRTPRGAARRAGKAVADSGGGAGRPGAPRQSPAQATGSHRAPSACG